MNFQAIDRIYDAVCEATGRTNTAAATIRLLLEVNDLASVAAVADRIKDSKSEHSKARMSVLRITLKRACKALERAPLGVKLDKATGRHVVAELETKEKDEDAALMKALALVLENIDNEEVIRALAGAMGVGSGAPVGERVA